MPLSATFKSSFRIAARAAFRSFVAKILAAAPLAMLLFFAELQPAALFAVELDFRSLCFAGVIFVGRSRLGIDAFAEKVGIFQRSHHTLGIAGFHIK